MLVLVVIGTEYSVDGMVGGSSGSFTIILALGELTEIVNVDVDVGQAGTDRTCVQDWETVFCRRLERDDCVGKGLQRMWRGHR